MKILHLSTFDTCGGAAIAAYRLHKGLHRAGVDSQMLVQKKLSDCKSVTGLNSQCGRIFSKLRSVLNGSSLKSYPDRKGIFSTQIIPSNIKRKIAKINPDVINLHWICAGYISIEEIANLNKPIIWTLHDMWSFTGGCHYSQECNRYTKSCGACPQLHSNKGGDLSNCIWKRKAKAWKNLNLTIVSPSKWLAKCAKSSSIFKNVRTEIIPNAIDTEIFRPRDKKLARKKLNLPQDKQIVLFGAINATKDERKGFNLLQSALQKLSKSGWKDKLELVVFGSSKPKNEIDLGFKSHYLGYLHEDISLALAYSAADVMVIPSIQDNLPSTLVEATACGTSCVAFDIGGLPDVIEHKYNGYLAQPFDINDLAKGIAWVLEDKKRHKKLVKSAREKAVKEFNLELQAQRYQKLYKMVLKKN